jgi:hypothetical protein
VAKRATEADPEQRRAARHVFITFAWYKRIDDAALHDEEGVARSCDVSEDGVGIVTSRPLPVSARLFLELIAGTTRLSALGRVVHSAVLPNGHFRLGVRIESVPPTCKLAWQRLIDHESRHD